jgi:hypothetical protein
MEIAGLNKTVSESQYADTRISGSTNYSNVQQSSRAAIYPVNNIRKSGHSTESPSRIFSPYTAPSAVHVENKALAQASGGPIFQHNIAITKYYHVSMTPKPRANQSMNILA